MKRLDSNHERYEKDHLRYTILIEARKELIKRGYSRPRAHAIAHRYANWII